MAGRERDRAENEKGKEEGRTSVQSRHPAARGGRRHTHGSWLINATLPLLVSIKEMTCHTPPYIIVQTPSCPWEGHFTAFSLWDTSQSLTLGLCSGRQNSKTPHTVQPCATGNPEDCLRNHSRLAFPRRTTAGACLIWKTHSLLTFHSSKTLVTVM